jgi:ComF family protein
LQQAIHHFKYKQRRELADTLGQMLYDYWQTLDLPVDLVLPVPLHADRQKERGFNQSALLAAVLSEHAQLPLDASHLVRTRATPPQVGLAPRERKVNVQGAFEWTGDQLDGVCVLLVDDVCTSGATLEACAAPLRKRGANAIWALTLTRPAGEDNLLV